MISYLQGIWKTTLSNDLEVSADRGSPVWTELTNLVMAL